MFRNDIEGTVDGIYLVVGVVAPRDSALASKGLDTRTLQTEVYRDFVWSPRPQKPSRRRGVPINSASRCQLLPIVPVVVKVIAGADVRGVVGTAGRSSFVDLRRCNAGRTKQHCRDHLAGDPTSHTISFCGSLCKPLSLGTEASQTQFAIEDSR